MFRSVLHHYYGKCFFFTLLLVSKFIQLPSNFPELYLEMARDTTSLFIEIAATTTTARLADPCWLAVWLLDTQYCVHPLYNDEDTMIIIIIIALVLCVQSDCN
jgi:hypothetical protein